MKRVCGCDCHEYPAEEEPFSGFCSVCAEEESMLADYYRTRESTAHQILEGLVGELELAKEWLEGK